MRSRTGPFYEKPEPWVNLGYHDSGWSEDVRRFIYDRVEIIEGLGIHGVRINAIPEAEQQALRAAIKLAQGR